MRELNIQEIESVTGGDQSTATGCYYNGTFYSPGSVVNMGGANYQCTYNGNYGGYTWSIFL